jgi:hypothetical protein
VYALAKWASQLPHWVISLGGKDGPVVMLGEVELIAEHPQVDLVNRRDASSHTTRCVSMLH